MTLINDLIKQGWLKSPAIIEAFAKIKRKDFLPAGSVSLAELNEALPIGFSQTISQPLVVAFMLELLQPKPGQKILDVGSGSGWTSALLAELVGKKGTVIAIEIVPELVEFGRANIAKYNFIKKGVVELIKADGSKGWLKSAPYDKILASASASKLPPAWLEQLKMGGRLVFPLNTSIWLLEKTKTGFQKTEYPGFVFVPLVSKTLPHSSSPSLRQLAEGGGGVRRGVII